MGDQFMDYGVTFFTYDLQTYADAFKKDGVPFFVAQWEATKTQDTWYSLFFLAKASHYVIELTSPREPAVDSKTLPKLEQRMSDDHVQKFKSYGAHPAHVLEISSISRATSSITTINDVYSNLFEAATTLVAHPTISRFLLGQRRVSMRMCVSRSAHQTQTRIRFSPFSISRRCSGRSTPARLVATLTAKLTCTLKTTTL